jgi:hypothetical protein
MMGHQQVEQAALFYEFSLERHVREADAARSHVNNKYRYSKPQTDLTSPPSIRSVEPVIQRAPGDTKKAISSAISSGSP